MGTKLLAFSSQFAGQIDRIASVFRRSTGKARVEMTIENQQLRLKPGMSIQATVVMERAPEATVIPEQALTTRNEKTGIFVVNDDGKSVNWREVKLGIREGDRVQVEGEGLSGRVVTLGQQLVGDGSAITISADQGKTTFDRERVG